MGKKRRKKEIRIKPYHVGAERAGPTWEEKAACHFGMIGTVICFAFMLLILTCWAMGGGWCCGYGNWYGCPPGMPMGGYGMAGMPMGAGMMYGAGAGTAMAATGV